MSQTEESGSEIRLQGECFLGEDTMALSICCLSIVHLLKFIFTRFIIGYVKSKSSI